MTVSTSFRAGEEKMARLDAVASAMGRSRSWLLNRAVDDALEYYEWYMQTVRRGIEDADAGRFASPEEVDAVLKRYGA